MHHITSEISTFHLSLTLSEMRWRVWRWMAKPSHAQWLCSLPSVAWDDFARTQPAHSPSQHARKRAASPRGNRWLRPIPWFCQRATVGRRSSHATDEAISALSWYRCDMRSRGFRHKYQNLASCYFDKVLLKQKVRMSFLMCFMFYQHQIRKKEKKKGNFFVLRSDAFCAIFLMLQTLCLKIRISVPKLRIFIILNTNFSFQRLAALGETYGAMPHLSSRRVWRLGRVMRRSWVGSPRASLSWAMFRFRR